MASTTSPERKGEVLKGTRLQKHDQMKSTEVLTPHVAATSFGGDEGTRAKETLPGSFPPGPTLGHIFLAAKQAR